MKTLLLALLLYSLCPGQVTIVSTEWPVRHSLWHAPAHNMQTEYVLRYIDAARLQHWARMRYAARSATAYCEYKYGERRAYKPDTVFTILGCW